MHNEEVKNCSIIFDTNAYRDFTYGKSYNEVVENTERLIDIENNQDIEAYMYPVVLLELYKHLAHPNDCAYENCKQSVVAAYLHTKFQDSDDFRILMDSESLLVKLLFNCKREDPEQMWNIVGTHAYQIYADPCERHLDTFRPNFRLFAEFVDKIESRFVNDMSTIVSALNPSAKDWHPLKEDDRKRTQILNYLKSDKSLLLFAEAQVYKACQLVKKDPESIDIHKYAERVKELFLTPLILYREIIKKIVISGCDLTRRNRGNWIWDIQILFGVGKGTLNNKRLILVTTDGEMLDAAKRARLEDKVLRLKDYLDSVGFN